MSAIARASASAVDGCSKSMQTNEELAASAAVRRHELIVLLVLSAVQFTSIVDFVVVMPLGPDLMESLKIGPDEFGHVVSAYTFAAGIAGLVASSFIDRVSRRSAFLSLYAGFLIGTLLCAFAPNYQLLVAARAITGCFGGILGGMAMAIVGDVFPEHRRGRATGALMSAFAIASVVGVPFGLVLGQNFGWHVPFVALVMMGVPVLVIGALALPPLAGHMGKAHAHPLKSLVNTFRSPANLNAFALSSSLMIGAFAVIPYISAYLVENVGMPEAYLPWVYVAGGALTLVVVPQVGKLADRHGKLLVFRIAAPISALMLIAVTCLPPVPTLIAVFVVGGLMVSNAARMVAALPMMTSAVPAQSRGGFMSANSSIQHIASGIGTSIGGWLIAKGPDGELLHYGTVGLIACGVTLLSVWLAGRLQPVAEEKEDLVPAVEHG